ncbi:MAG: YqhV family protein [Firmicutes bacterium]|nr:YqhV family protein [Bacillota bacterium]
MFKVYDPVVWGMAGLRFISSCIEFTAALLMLYFGRVETAFEINALLSLIGPTVLFTVTFLGLYGLAGRLSPVGFISVLTGIGLIFYGVSKLR